MTGPSVNVTGASTKLGNATDVSQSRFTPWTELMWCVKNGFIPCATA